MDEATAHTAVAIRKRMNRLELRVRDRSLLSPGKILPIEEGREVLEQPWHVLRGRWNELRAARAERLATEPVLLVAHDSSQVSVARLISAWCSSSMLSTVIGAAPAPTSIARSIARMFPKH